MWINSLKIAIIEEDFEQINTLIDTIAQDLNTEEKIEASYLIQEALTLLNAQQTENILTMSQLQKNINFLKSTTNSESNFDITS